MTNADRATKAISHLDSSRHARAAGDIGSAESAIDAARNLMLEIAGLVMSNDEIIDIRNRLLITCDARNLSVLENNILRDCDIALRVVRCAEGTAAEARARLERYRSQGATT